jgi:flagellar export protein FliJ
VKKFRFKFSTILKHRKTREEEALRRLGEAQAAYQAELREKARISGELDQSLLRRERLGNEPTAIMAFRLEQDFITGTKQRLIRQEQAIIRASRSVEKALRAYLITRRQTQMMERLYEQHFEEFKKERARKEQREMDDLTVMRARMIEEEGVA